MTTNSTMSNFSLLLQIKFPVIILRHAYYHRYKEMIQNNRVAIMTFLNAILFNGKEKSHMVQHHWHKNYVAISVQIKFGHRCSSLAILVILPTPVGQLVTNTIISSFT